MITMLYLSLIEDFAAFDSSRDRDLTRAGVLE